MTVAQSKKKFYITTTLPYVNAEPHIGFAVELVRADTVARFRKACGDEVFFNTGTDEHGLKIYQGAEKAGQTPEEYIKPHVQKFRDLIAALGIDSEIVHFTRTTDPHHVAAAQEFWRRCKANGDISLKQHKIKYCVGCELEKTDSELVDGHCPLHPNLKIEIIDEENYFFNFKKYKERLLELYSRSEQFVIPATRLVEIKTFIERGPEDFSISRLAAKMPWGVPVPDDPRHVMYVWFEALVSYISALGWPEDEKKFAEFWQEGTPVQYCGKDNLRQQAAIWQAMLMSAGLPTSHRIVIDGFVTAAGGVKMSKSLGNTVSPFDIVAEYGTDALRYFVLAELSPFEDSPFTPELFKTVYNAKLANGLGNLVNRVMKMATTNDVALSQEELANNEFSHSDTALIDAVVHAGLHNYAADFEKFSLQDVCSAIWELIRMDDEMIQSKKPFALIKTDPEQARSVIVILLRHLLRIGKILEPIMPETAAKIQGLVRENRMPAAPLFPRKE